MRIPEIPVSLTAEEKLDVIWKHVTDLQGKVKIAPSTPKKNNGESKDGRHWPSYNEVLNDLRKSDYDEILTCPLDLHPGKPEPKRMRLSFPLSPNQNSQQQQPPRLCRNKMVCPQGVVCTAKIELFDFPSEGIKGRPYSGLLQPGTTVEHCLVRLSSALQPVDMGNNQRVAKLMFGDKLANAKIFPSVAIKILRTEQNSANALFLGSKVGQKEDEFFSHCLSTQLTSKMPLAMKPIAGYFKKYSQYPLAIGLSDLCSYDADGKMVEDLNFPFCLTLHPKVRTKINFGRTSGLFRSGMEDDNTNKSQDSFLDDIRAVGKGSTLYDIYASPDPHSVVNPEKLQRIGRVVSTSAMKTSPHDDGIFFRHQKKDEDFALRPQWKEDLDTKVVLKDGEQGTVATFTGWRLFEEQIQEGTYKDFERK